MLEQIEFRFMEDSASACALPEGGAGFARRSAERNLKDFPVASSKSEFWKGDYRGFRRGQKIYFLCPFHCERTPSCVWSPAGSIAQDPWNLGTHAELVALATVLMLGSLHAEGVTREKWGAISLRVHWAAIGRWWYERCPRQPTRHSHFHCYGCGKTGDNEMLIQGLLNPYRHPHVVAQEEPCDPELRDESIPF